MVEDKNMMMEENHEELTDMAQEEVTDDLEQVSCDGLEGECSVEEIAAAEEMNTEVSEDNAIAKDEGDMLQSYVVEFEGRTLNMIFPEGYCILKSGKILVEDKKKGWKTVCNHPIFPYERALNYDSKEEGLYIIFLRDGVWHKEFLPKKMAYSSTGVKSLAAKGVSVGTENAKQLAGFIQNIEDLNRDYMLDLKPVTNHLGWLDDTYTRFTPYAKDIRVENAHIYQNEYNAVTSVSKGTAEDWINLFRPYRDEQHITARIAMAASFASVLVKPASALPFILDVWGNTTSIGKTVALKVIASVWADPDRDYIKTFNSTEVARVRMASFYCNLPLCFDEQQINRYQSSLEHFIYEITQGSGKAQGGNGGIMAQAEWRNSVIVSGEQPMNTDRSMSGSQARVIEMECTGPIYSSNPAEMNTLCANIKTCYGTAGREFIAKLTQGDQMDHAMERYREYFSILNTIDGEKIADKQIPAAALILTADELITEWLFKDGNQLAVEDILPYLKRSSDLAVNQKAEEAIQDWIITHPEKIGSEIGADSYGKYVQEGDRKAIAFLPTKFEKLMDELHYNLESYISWCRANGKIKVDKENKVKTNVKIKLEDGRTQQKRCYVFYLDNNVVTGSFPESKAS